MYKRKKRKQWKEKGHDFSVTEKSGVMRAKYVITKAMGKYKLP
jgi:hypothetical protein